MGRRREFKLTEDEVKRLEMVECNSKDGATRARYQAIRLYGLGYRADEVRLISKCSASSLMEWCQCYRQEGISGLIDKRVGGTRAKLSAEQVEHLQHTMERYTPDQKWGAGDSVGGEFWTIADVRRLVKQECSMAFESNTSYRTLMSLCGMSYQKTQRVYKNRSADKVAEFEEQLEKNSRFSPKPGENGDLSRRRSQYLPTSQ